MKKTYHTPKARIFVLDLTPILTTSDGVNIQGGEKAGTYKWYGDDIVTDSDTDTAL